jgi:hypothetical protein
MSSVRLSSHAAQLTGWLQDIIDTKELNFLTVEYQVPVITDNGSLIKVFENNLNLGMHSLAKVEDDALYEKWILRNGNK